MGPILSTEFTLGPITGLVFWWWRLCGLWCRTVLTRFTTLPPPRRRCAFQSVDLARILLMVLFHLLTTKFMLLTQLNGLG
jgi:hypothetical protein